MIRTHHRYTILSPSLVKLRLKGPNWTLCGTVYDVPMWLVRNREQIHVHTQLIHAMLVCWYACVLCVLCVCVCVPEWQREKSESYRACTNVLNGSAVNNFKHSHLCACTIISGWVWFLHQNHVASSIHTFDSRCSHARATEQHFHMAVCVRAAQLVCHGMKRVTNTRETAAHTHSTIIHNIHTWTRWIWYSWMSVPFNAYVCLSRCYVCVVLPIHRLRANKKNKKIFKQICSGEHCVWSIRVS